MSALVPCPGCDRHVKSEDTTCPFCQAALAPARPCTGCSGPSAPRLVRAALVAAGAALLGAACQSSTSVLVPYGVPPHFDAAAPSGGDAGSDRDAGSDQDARKATDGPPDSGDAAK
jgi:hypothetical protein